jgi:hypothetical protein
MIDKLSRRDLVILGSVGLAASGCQRGIGYPDNKQATDQQRGTGKRNDNFKADNVLSQCEDWGYSTKTKPKDGTLFPVDFEAPYICVLHINFSEPWRMQVNYASFPMGNDFSDTGRQTKALDILREKLGIPNGSRIEHFSDLKKIPTYNGSDHRDFSKFGFKSQHELFVFFESPNVQFADTLVVFTKVDPNHPDIPYHQNFSFVNATEVTKGDMGNLYSRGRMFRMRNYVQDEDGHPIDASKKEKRRYGMNIHFKIPGANNDLVPIVIDPDTGNGAGNEP